MTSMRANGSIAAVIGLVLATGCAQDDELLRLRQENLRLRAELERLAKAPEAPAKLTPVSEFTVGLAAAEKEFDEGAFLALLKDSLNRAVIGEASFSVTVESDPVEIAKARGMLVQQYLGARKVPIRITNLTFRLRNPSDRFKIGGTVVPEEGLECTPESDGGVACSFKGPLVAEMERDAEGRYAITYEDSSGANGRIPVEIRDVELFDPEQPPQAARLGDVALNWQLSLEKVRVYRVRGFTGDMGRFMQLMRYPRSTSRINQYQTIRDAVFLFGYGPYRTGLLNQITTPAYISRVEVMAVTPEVFERLEPGMTEEELQDVLGSAGGGWIECRFVDFSGEEKVWERPVTVGFPFVSRQTSIDRQRVFYAKYDTQGPSLIGDYSLRTR